MKVGAAQDFDEISRWLAIAVAEKIEVSPDDLDPRRPFSEYGLGSAEAVVLVGELQEWLGRELPATLLWEFASIAKLSAFLASR
ncbi:MAG: acyl carrier protein [Acidobacteriia bacterium]|nr:acyl carrier protein [Terriglobia bacterium]